MKEELHKAEMEIIRVKHEAKMEILNLQLEISSLKLKIIRYETREIIYENLGHIKNLPKDN